MTQDGRIARQLIGEDSVMEKEYLVRVEYYQDGNMSDQNTMLPVNSDVQSRLPSCPHEQAALWLEPRRPAAETRQS